MGKMDVPRWQELSPLIDELLQATLAQRLTKIEQLRRRDPSIAHALTDLLSSERALEQESFHPALADVLAQPLEHKVVGRYTLDRPLGQGGMGTVWLAHRSDGHYEAQVAIKFLHSFLVAGGETERFHREGNYLGRLTHPNIAHLIDAGVTEERQPYLVLEYVQGEPVDVWCNARKQHILRRIRLFIDVLSAVAHAHGKLILHRDLKPSNILVSSEGQAKLLDFGIAKLLRDPELPSQPTLTERAGRAFTPQYASPEQLSGGELTTASDVYSLGVVLYILLTGQHPFAEHRGSLLALMRVVCEEDPQRPSQAVLSTRAESAQSLCKHADARSLTPQRLSRLLHGELDAIVGKALSKEPQQRYATVAAFAEDLKRYLGHEPISARKDTWSYRAAKFIRRYRVPVAISSTAVLLMAAGLVGTVTQARRARAQAELAKIESSRADREARAASEQRNIALRQLSRAEAMNELNSFLLSDAAPTGKPFTVGDLLAKAEQVLEHPRAGAEEENRVEMLISVGQMYWVQEDVDRARAVLERAYSLSSNVADRSVRASAACTLASTVARVGEFERAGALLEESQREMPAGPEQDLTRVHCLRRAGEVERERENGTLAIERIREAQALLEGSSFAGELLDLRLSMDLAESYRVAGRLTEASQTFGDAWKSLVSVGRDQTETGSTLLNNWAMTTLKLGQPREAEQLFRRALAVESAGEDDRGLSPMLLNNMARPLFELARYAEAAEYSERAYQLAVRSGHDVVTRQSLSLRTRIYISQRRLLQAHEAHDELQRRVKRELPTGHGMYMALERDQALLARAERRYNVAEHAADQAIQLLDSSDSKRDYLPELLLNRAELREEVGRHGDALADAERMLQLEQERRGGEGPSSILGVGQLVLGRALQAQGRHAEAVKACETAHAYLDSSLGAAHPRTRAALACAQAP